MAQKSRFFRTPQQVRCPTPSLGGSTKHHKDKTFLAFLFFVWTPPPGPMDNHKWKGVGVVSALLVHVHHADVEHLEETLSGITATGTGDKIQYFLGPGAEYGVELCGKRKGILFSWGGHKVDPYHTVKTKFPSPNYCRRHSRRVGAYSKCSTMEVPNQFCSLF